MMSRDLHLRQTPLFFTQNLSFALFLCIIISFPQSRYSKRSFHMIAGKRNFLIGIVATAILFCGLVFLEMLKPMFIKHTNKPCCLTTLAFLNKRPN